jgi:GxxExxY protein
MCPPWQFVTSNRLLIAITSANSLFVYCKSPEIKLALLDLLVEGRIVVELKAVERIHPIHLAQVITYLNLTGYPAGLLMNFNSVALRSGLRRVKHPNLYVKNNLDNDV